MVELREEQKRVVEFDNGNMLVTASAGSGKTHVMIERAIRLISQGKATVKEILAVTFTEAAADEMKERLKKALIDKVSGGEDWLAEQINEVSVADVCTIHSFCSKLIRRYFFACEVSPDFKVIDDAQAGVLRSESLEKTFKELYGVKEEWFLTLTDRYKKKRSDFYLKDVIKSLQNYVLSEAYPEVFMDKYIDLYRQENFDLIKAEYKEYVNKTLNSLQTATKSLREQSVLFNFDKATVVLDNLKAYIQSGIDGDLYDAVKLNATSVSMTFGTKLSEEHQQIREDVKALYKKIKDYYKRIDKSLTTEEEDRASFEHLKEHTEKLTWLLKAYLKNYSDAKKEENCLDFNDLEHFALDILSDQTVIDEIKNRYKYIFADEYQDVNGVQEAILSKISNDNLFMVGDAKQSIYGFRGCLADAFNQKEKAMRRAGERVETLNANFRSANAVIQTVNKVFSFSMTEEFQGVNYARDALLNFGGSYPENASGRTQLHFLIDDREKAEKNSSEESPRVYNILEELEPKEKEYDYTSALIYNVINSELGKTYYHPKDKKEYRITYKDVAVLARSVDNEYVRKIVSGLEARGIPVSSKVTKIALDYPEVKVLINLLKVIDCFNQDAPLYVVLKSKIGNFSEEELLYIANLYKENPDNKGYFYQAVIHALESAETQVKNKLKAFFEYIEKIRFLADFLGAKKILEKVILDTGYENFLLAEENGDKKIGRINLFIEKAQKDGLEMTVKEFLLFIESNPKAFEMTDCTEEDNVSVLTMHKSKGLEYPVVIVCGLEKPGNLSDESAEVLLDREYGFATKLYKDQEKISSSTIVRGLFKERIAEKRRKEEQRVFYVALTRAAYSLHMICESKTDPRTESFVYADKFINFVPKSLNKTIHYYSSLEDETKAIEKKSVLFSKLDLEKTERFKKNLSYVYPFSEEVLLPLKATVTGVTSKKEEYYATYQIGDYDKTGAEAGTIAHKILETYSFDGGDLALHAEKLVEDGIISNEEKSLINFERLNNALSLDIFKEVGKGKKYKEQPFITSISANKILNVKSSEKVLIQGIIDLLVKTEEGYIIIDYKYSRLDSEKLKEKYSAQIELYSYAIEKILGEKVIKRALVNVYSGEVIIV